MLGLIKKRERMQVLIALALALGSSSATIAGTIAALTYGTQPYVYAEGESVA